MWREMFENRGAWSVLCSTQVFCHAVSVRKNILKSLAASEKWESYQAGEFEPILIQLNVKTNFIHVDPHQ